MKQGKNFPGRGHRKYKGGDEFSGGETECGWSGMGKVKVVWGVCLEGGQCLISPWEAMVENLGSLHEGKT